MRDFKSGEANGLTLLQSSLVFWRTKLCHFCSRRFSCWLHWYQWYSCFLYSHWCVCMCDFYSCSYLAQSYKCVISLHVLKICVTWLTVSHSADSETGSAICFRVLWRLNGIVITCVLCLWSLYLNAIPVSIAVTNLWFTAAHSCSLCEILCLLTCLCVYVYVDLKPSAMCL